jgi:hypothetical protein
LVGVLVLRRGAVRAVVPALVRALVARVLVFEAVRLLAAVVRLRAGAAVRLLAVAVRLAAVLRRVGVLRAGVVSVGVAAGVPVGSEGLLLVVAMNHVLPVKRGLFSSVFVLRIANTCL